ncbi:MAG: GNAT family N-acetyltransferase [Alphaproteobacteria bacterium]
MKITQKPKLSEKTWETIEKGFQRQAIRKKELSDVIRSFAFEMRDERKRFVGAITGNIYYGCIFTDTLYIEEAYRKKGYGKQLLEVAERLGKKEACTFATVSTMDWEAHDFYIKQGYVVEHIRKGYKNGSFLYMMRKDFL